jgi:uncharacterized small protein (DUF1192 family)
VEIYKTVLIKKTMGKKKKALQAEIDRLNAQRPKTEVTSYKNIDQTPRTSVAATLGSSMTGYKTSSGPSMYGATYNYKNINSCGPSMEGEKKGLKRMDETDNSKLNAKTGLITNLGYAAIKAKDKLKAKADEIEGKPGRAGVKKMAAESLFRLGEAGVKSAASLIANKRKANLGSSNAFSPRQRSGGGGYSSKSQPSYAELLSKYQS